MLEETVDRTQELGTKKVSHLLWIYAWPAVLSQIIASIYNIVDRIFIGQGVGSMAIAGLAITFPLINIIHAFGSLIGVGAAARMSIVLGRKDNNWAENILGNSMVYTFILSGSVVLYCYLFMDGILLSFGATPETLSYAREYMLYVLPGMFFTTVTYNLTGLIRSSGYPTKSMIILAAGAILNTILDPIFIFVFEWGIKGAALATTIAMTSTAIAAIIHFIDRKSFIRFRKHGWKPRTYIFKNIILIGMSPFLMNIAASGVVAILNQQLLRYGGDLAVGTYGIINTFGLLMILLFVGICQGMQPIAGYNYGAGKTERLKDIYVLTLKTCVIIGAFGALICCAFPAFLIRFFTSESKLIEIGRPAMRLMMVMFPFIAFTVVNSNFFQSIDKPWIAIVTSLSRQVIFLIPCCYIVPELFIHWGINGLTGVWSSCTICDFIGAVLAAILLWTQRKVFRSGYQPDIRKPKKEYGDI